MIILANIPVEKVENKLTGTYTYRHESMPVDVIAVGRSPCSYFNKQLNRFYYKAFIKPPMQLHKDYGGMLTSSGLYSVNIVRKGLNSKWKPPIFPKNVNYIEINNEQKK